MDPRKQLESKRRMSRRDEAFIRAERKETQRILDAFRRLTLFHLSDGRGNWITCCPLNETDAEVVGGTWYCHEIIRLPQPHTWTSAARSGSGQATVGPPPATVVTPFDVEVVFDVLTGHCADPQYARWSYVENDAMAERCYRAWLEGLAERLRRRAA